MTDVSTMSDRELEWAIAEAMPSGIVLKPFETAICNGCRVSGGVWLLDESRFTDRHEWGRYVLMVPDYTTDLNALRDGPERVLREAGWRLTVATQGDWAGAAWRFPVFPSPFAVPKQSEASTEARARAEAALAALAALLVMNGETA